MKWLVTAFEPFGGGKSNSSQIAVRELQKMEWKKQVEFFEPVPVCFNDAWPAVREALKSRPHIDGVLSLGQAERRTKLSLERVALNWIDARAPDNKGIKPPQGKIENGPDSIFCPIPWERLADSMAWERSYSAGTYVCNTLLYQMLNAGQRMAGFIHVPLLDSQFDKAYDGFPRQNEAQTVQSLAVILKFLTALA